MGTMTASELKGRIRAHGLTQAQFGREAGMSQQEVSDVLNGAPVGDVVRRRIERAIVSLGLDGPAPTRPPVVFRVGVSSGATAVGE